MNYKGMDSPISSKITNPVKKVSKSNLKSQHTKTLAQSGVRPPKSPVS